MYLWGDFLQLLTRPRAAFALIRGRRRVTDGILAFAIAAVAGTLPAELSALKPLEPTASLASLPPEFQEFELGFIDWLNGQRFAIPAYRLIAILVLFIAAVALIHFVATRLGGRGSLRGYLTLAGYISSLGILAVPASLLETMTRLAAQEAARRSFAAAVPVLAVGVFVWQNVLYILAAQTHYSISGERAALAVIGPVGCGIALLVGLAVLVGIFAAVRAGGLF